MEMRLTSENSAAEALQGDGAPVVSLQPSAFQYEDTPEIPSWEAFMVILQSLTVDERRVVETLWMEGRPLSYADLRILTGKRTVHAIKKHIHNLQAKGFPLTFFREGNGCKRYYLTKAVSTFLEKLSPPQKASKRKRKATVKNRGH